MKDKRETVTLIIRALVSGAILVFCLLTTPYAAQIAKCPEGQWWNPETGQCVTPGDDPTGKVDRAFRQQLVMEGQGYCVDGWWCPEEKAYDKCANLNDEARSQCLKRGGCFVYGE